MTTTTRDQELSARLAKTLRWGNAYRQPRRLAMPTQPESPTRPRGGEASVHRLDARRRRAR